MTASINRLLIADDFGGDELFEIDPDGSDSQGGCCATATRA